MKTSILVFGVIFAVLAQLAEADDAEKKDTSPAPSLTQTPAEVTAFVEKRRLNQVICDAAQRIYESQKRLEREKEYAKVGGVIDREKIYRFSRGIVEGRRELHEGMAGYKELTGKAFNGSDLMKCDYFSE